MPSLSRVVVLLFLLFGWGASHGLAQASKPNLSGAWKLNGAKTRHPQWWHEIRDYTCVIDHSEPKITMTQISQRGHATEHYVTDGEERLALPPYEGDQLRAKAYWDGNTLVIEKHREWADHRDGVWTIRYELSTDGKTLYVSEHFLKSSYSDKPFDVFRTFERQR